MWYSCFTLSKWLNFVPSKSFPSCNSGPITAKCVVQDSTPCSLLAAQSTVPHQLHSVLIHFLCFPNSCKERTKQLFQGTGTSEDLMDTAYDSLTLELNSPTSHISNSLVSIWKVKLHAVQLRFTDCTGLEKTLKGHLAQHPCKSAETPPTRSGCAGPHEFWSWMSPETTGQNIFPPENKVDLLCWFLFQLLFTNTAAASSSHLQKGYKDTRHTKI